MTYRDIADTMEGRIVAFEILNKYIEVEDQKFPLTAENNVVYSIVDTDSLPENSEDGKALVALGWHVSGNVWATFT